MGRENCRFLPFSTALERKWRQQTKPEFELGSLISVYLFIATNLAASISYGMNFKFKKSNTAIVYSKNWHIWFFRVSGNVKLFAYLISVFWNDLKQLKISMKTVNISPKLSFLDMHFTRFHYHAFQHFAKCCVRVLNPRKDRVVYCEINHFLSIFFILLCIKDTR